MHFNQSHLAASCTFFRWGRPVEFQRLQMNHNHFAIVFHDVPLLQFLSLRNSTNSRYPNKESIHLAVNGKKITFRTGYY